MARVRFSKGWIHLIFLLSGCLYFSECSREDPDPPDGTEGKTITRVIGTAGGSLGNEHISITIHPGAFDREHTLQLSASADHHPFAAQQVSPLFKLNGFPGDISAPVTITIKHGENLQEESFIAYGQMEYLEDSVTSWLEFDLTTCTDSSGYLVGILVPSGLQKALQPGGTAGVKSTSRRSGEIERFFAGVTDFTPYSKSGSPFLIQCPASLVLNPRFLELPDYLDVNYLLFQSLIGQANFNAAQILPERINVFDDRNTSNSTSDIPCFRFGTNDYYKHPGIKTNEFFNYTIFPEAPDMNELSMAIGMAFFRAFQRYTLFNREQKSYSPDWFSEAGRLWIGEIFADPEGTTDDYIPEELTGNETAVFSEAGWGAWLYRGLVPLVKYLADTYGDQVVFLYHYHRWQKRDVAGALELSTGITAGEWFPGFLADYLEGGVYNVPGQIFTDAVTASFDLHNLDAPLRLEDQYAGLRAKIYRFNTDKITEEHRGAKFSIESQDTDPSNSSLQVFTINRNSREITCIKDEGRSYTEVHDLKSFTDQNLDLIVVVGSAAYSDGHQGTDEITLVAEPMESLPFPFQKLSLELNHFTGDIDYTDGSSKTFTNIRLPLTMPRSIHGRFTGNLFSARWDEQFDAFSQDSGHVYASVIESGIDTQLISFDFLKVTEDFEDNSRWGYRLTGGYIPLSMVEGKGLTGRVDGIDIQNHMTGFLWQVDYYDEDGSLKDASYRISNVRFTTESYLEVTFHFME